MNINDAGLIVVVCGDGATEFSISLIEKVYDKSSFALSFCGGLEFDGVFSDEMAAQIWAESVVDDMNRIADLFDSGVSESRVYAFDECDFKANSESERIFKHIVDESDLVFVTDDKEHKALQGSNLGRFALNLSVDDAAQLVSFVAVMVALRG